MTVPMTFDFMGIMLNKQAMEDYDFTINVNITDSGENHMVRVKNGVVLYYENGISETPDISVTCPKQALFLVLQNNMEALNKYAKIEGNKELLGLFMSNLNQINTSETSSFNIIEP